MKSICVADFFCKRMYPRPETGQIFLKNCAVKFPDPHCWSQSSQT